METNKFYQIIRVAKMYYEMQLGQEEIARIEGISKSTVSRLLQKGIDNGYIKIHIDYPIESVANLEEKLKSRFGLKEAFVLPVLVNDETLILKDICVAAANLLDNYIHDDDVIGVSWGITMNYLAKAIHKLSANHIKVVQMNGGIPRHTISTGVSEIVASLAKAGNGEGYQLPVPAIVDNKIIADVLKNDSQVSNILSLARSSTTAIFGIGAVTKDSMLHQAGYFQADEFQHLIDLNAVGDICSRYFNGKGEIVDPNLDSRVMGIALEDIPKKKNRIAIASGNRKVQAIYGALKGGYPNILFTDEKTAEKVLRLANNKS